METISKNSDPVDSKYDADDFLSFFEVSVCNGDCDDFLTSLKNPHDFLTREDLEVRP